MGLLLGLESLLTKTTWGVREMGFFREVVGIRRRFRRCKHHWKEHLEHCHATILKAADRCSRHRKVAVLGAGLIHDVPLDALCQRFREVVLVDIVHPRFARIGTRDYPNLTRLTADISDSVEQLYRIRGNPNEPLPVGTPTLFLNDSELDLTISLNLASQLPCMPRTWLKQWRIFSEAQLDDFCQRMIGSHFQWLDRLPGRVAVVTDIERFRVDALRRVDEVLDLLYGLRIKHDGERWIWKLAPAPEVSPQYSYYRRVLGVHDWK